MLNTEPEPVNATVAKAAHHQQCLNITYTMIMTQLNLMV
jgi:hypothetical protein